MTRRRRANALAGRTATVRVDRCGASIEVHDVDAPQAVLVLADILSAFRELSREFEELVSILPDVPGGSPVVYEDDWSAESGQRQRKVGFTSRDGS